MGTTLTGTTPQDTYDSLIKVTDNGPLSGSLKTLTDGLGNDSALALSTGGASITGTLAVSGNATFDTSTLVVDAANNRVGIGTATPQGPLEVKGDTDYDSPKSIVITHAEPTVYSGFIGLRQEGLANSVMAFGTRSASVDYLDTLSLSNGKVGIGTSSPDSKLHVAAGNIRLGVALDNATYYVGKATAGTQTFRGAVGFPSTTGLDEVSFSTHESGVFAGEVARFTGTQYLRFASGTGGIQFNGDTAAANALDDYEEGDWTPAITFDGGSTGITYQSRGGKYTKVGRQVSVSAYILLSSKGSSAGAAAIEGLPFTIANAVGFYSSAPLSALTQLTFSGIPSGYGAVGSTKIELVESLTTGTQLGISNTNFTNSTQILLQFTYFV